MRRWLIRLGWIGVLGLIFDVVATIVSIYLLTYNVWLGIGALVVLFIIEVGIIRRVFKKTKAEK